MQTESNENMAKIKLEFEGGEVFIANLLMDEAPETCAHFLTHLPFTARFRNSSTAGQAIVTFPKGFDMPKENQRTVGIMPGSLCFLVRYEPMRVPDEIYVTYGPYFISRGFRTDYQEPVNVFGQIENDLDLLALVGARFPEKGAETVTFSLLE
ncbi:hypothetical protein MASR2M74_00260 [Paracoccaceae bacterium]